MSVPDNTVGQHCNVRERAKANKKQSPACRETENTPERLVDFNTFKKKKKKKEIQHLMLQILTHPHK